MYGGVGGVESRGSPLSRSLALFGRRPPQRVDSLVTPASENLHTSGSEAARDHLYDADRYRSISADEVLDHRDGAFRCISQPAGIHSISDDAAEFELLGRHSGNEDWLRSRPCDLTRWPGIAGS
jgi:hypothetical protein